MRVVTACSRFGYMVYSRTTKPDNQGGTTELLRPCDAGGFFYWDTFLTQRRKEGKGAKGDPAPD
jgi:hypothetical protein